MRPIEDDRNEAEPGFGCAPESVGAKSHDADNMPSKWPTSGYIVYEGNGATSHNYAKEFAARGIQGFYSSSGSGSRKYVALQPIMDEPSDNLVINGFSHKEGQLVGFHVRKRVADTWMWLTQRSGWQETSEDMEKVLVQPNQDMSELNMPIGNNTVLEAQWVSSDGHSANCGSRMFSNRLMAHALGGFRNTTYTNSRAAFEHSLENEHTYFEVDLSYTLDERLIASSPRITTSDTQKLENIAEMTYERVMSLTVSGEPVMDGRQLYEIVRHHPQFTFEIDFHRVVGEDAKKRIESLLNDFQHDDEALSWLLIPVHSAQMHKDLDSVYQFQHYQYLLGMKMERLDSAITYCLDTGICALALRWGLVTQSIIKQIKAAGLYILGYTVEKDAPLADALLRSGIDTICTDFVTPELLQEASGSEGQKEFYVFYHSGSPNAVASFSTKDPGSDPHRTLHKLKSGAFEMRDDKRWKNDGFQQLHPPRFALKGKRFVGWRMRVRIDGKPRWYCTDGTFRNKKETLTAPATERYLFHDHDTLPIIQTVDGAKVVMVAAWEPASRLVRLLDKMLPIVRR